MRQGFWGVFYENCIFWWGCVPIIGTRCFSLEVEENKYTGKFESVDDKHPKFKGIPWNAPTNNSSG
jgi:hypothetical protein